jgi:hypothetical protein
MQMRGVRNGASSNHFPACHECNALVDATHLPFSVTCSSHAECGTSFGASSRSCRDTHPSLHHLSSPLRIFAQGVTTAHRECSRSSSSSLPLVGNFPHLVELSCSSQAYPRIPAHCLPPGCHASPRFSSTGAARMRSIASDVPSSCHTLLNPHPCLY